MTIAPMFSNGSPSPTQNTFYHPRRSNNNLHAEIEHVMRLMSSASLPQNAASVDVNNNGMHGDKMGYGAKSWNTRSVPTDQCLYVQIPDNSNGGLF